MINFCYDAFSNGQGHPNLALWSAQPFTKEWREFDMHWPRTIPLRLSMYLDDANIEYGLHSVNTAPPGCWYPIAFSWFDFDCDYISLMSDIAKEKVKKGIIKILFYYHEGENPNDIKNQIDKLCNLHNFPNNSYVFVSANSAARDLENFIYFQEHESFFRHVNQHQVYIEPNESNRIYDFTMLNRAHKWWRASCTAELLHQGILDNSLWSYHSYCDIGDEFWSNPLQILKVRGWRARILEFVKQGPYYCDQLDLTQKNDHRIINQDLYSHSFFNIVTETFLSIHQSTGTFITEKTFKCIKYGQPFIIIGPQGTLAELRKSGYRTFDSVLDNRYDTINDPTERWFAILELLISMKNSGIKDLFLKCLPDVKHNQEIFNKRQKSPLNILLKEITCQS